MQKIYLVISNVKHNGTFHQAGGFITHEGESSQFENLVKDGVLRLIDGAKNAEEAAKIVSKEKEVAGDNAQKEKEQKPENTWGPKKDESPAQQTEDKKTTEAQGSNAQAPTDAVKTEDKPASTVGSAEAPKNTGDNL